MSSFGWGQRQCLGMSLTQDELIVACGALAWCFNLRPKRDSVTGMDLPVPINKSNSLLIIKPDPFQMSFEPRSQERREEALRLWDEAETDDRRHRTDFLAAARASRQPPLRTIPPPQKTCPSTVHEKKEVVIEINRVDSAFSTMG